MIKSIKYHWVWLLAMLLLLANFGCIPANQDHKLKYDHILFFVNDYALKDSLDAFFTPAEKLTTEHKSQGTIGYYYLFYNTYIELLFLADTTVAKENKANFGSDYLLRWIQDEQFCPVGFGMQMTPWDTTAIHLNFHKYQSKDSPEGEYYLMSKDNNDPSQPFIYISQPHRAYQSLASLEDIEERDEEIRDDLRKYLTHKRDLKKITQIIYAYTNENKLEGNLTILLESSMVDVVKSNSASITLVFDNQRNEQKEWMLNNQTRLIIQY